MFTIEIDDQSPKEKYTYTLSLTIAVFNCKLKQTELIVSRQYDEAIVLICFNYNMLKPRIRTEITKFKPEKKGEKSVFEQKEEFLQLQISKIKVAVSNKNHKRVFEIFVKIQETLFYLEFLLGLDSDIKPPKNKDLFVR